MSTDHKRACPQSGTPPRMGRQAHQFMPKHNKTSLSDVRSHAEGGDKHTKPQQNINNQHPADAAVNRPEAANARARRVRRLASEPDWVAISARRVSQRKAIPGREVFEVTLSDLNNEGVVTRVRAERSANRREEVI